MVCPRRTVNNNTLLAIPNSTIYYEFYDKNSGVSTPTYIFGSNQNSLSSVEKLDLMEYVRIVTTNLNRNLF